MTLKKSLALAAAISMIAAGGTAHAQSAETQGAFRLLQRVATQYAVMVARSFVDLTYDSLTIEPGTNQMVISGLTLYPELDWDQDGNCAIAIDRISSSDVTSFETLQTTLEISGVAMPTACLDPDVGGMVSSFGYGDGLYAETVSIDIAYDLPTSGADITVQAAVTDAADISIAATFDYLWFRVPIDGPDDEPIPVAYLGEAEIAIQNNGLWEKVEPMIGAQMGDLNAVPQMAQMMIGQALSEGGTRTPNEVEQAFVENLSSELARFLSEKNRLVVTVAPERSVLLDENAFESPGDAINILRPQISAVPVAFRKMVSPAELSAALGGGALDDAARLKVGKALLSGIGAPRAVNAGLTLLQPLADAWNGEAALAMAKASAEAGDHKAAYAMAMRALAGGEAGAMSEAETAEANMSTADILAAQSAASDAWPGIGAVRDTLDQLIAAGDISGLRSLANAAAIGKDMPRDYVGAYYLATLAAAGGDKGAGNLRARLDRRFAGDAAWTTAASESAGLALQTWTGGMAETIAKRVQ